MPWGHPASQDEVRDGAGICLHRVKERHHRGRPNSSSESSAKHSRHASERRKSPSPSPGQRSSSWSSSGSLSKSRSRSREKRAGRSRSRSPSPKKPASRSGPGGQGHGGHRGCQQLARRASRLRVVPAALGLGVGSQVIVGHTGNASPRWECHPCRVSLHPTRDPSPLPDPSPPPPPRGVERRTTSPEHVTVIPIPPVPGAAPGATPPSGSGGVTPPASWSPGGSPGGSWRAAKALPRLLARPGAELCCQLTPKGAGVGG